MVHLIDLWKPILLSAVLVFVASAIIWMALPIHKHDYKNPGDKEKPLIDFLKSQRFAPGVYYVPWCHGKQKDPAVMEQMKSGPWAMLTVMPSGPNMGKNLGAWFLHLLIIAVLIGYVAGHGGLAPGAAYLRVFQIVAALGLLAHAGYALPMAIWHGMPWSQLPGRIFDGVIYAALTAGTFAWLWPVTTTV